MLSKGRMAIGSLARRFVGGLRDESGQGMAEYVVVLVAICITLAAISLLARNWVLFSFSRYSLMMSLPIP